MPESEIHLFIIWSKALNKKDEILNDLSKKFFIKRIFRVFWSKEKFSENLSRLYGENLPPGSHKEKHCGTDDFLCIVVEDQKPVYLPRKTSKGKKVVNTKTFDAKYLYRKWTGGGHKIHATDNAVESKIQTALIFGKDINDFFKEKADLTEKRWNKDLAGAYGWKDFKELFHIMNITLEYVVLRNFENLEQEILSAHPDVDLLVKDRNLAKHILNAKPTQKKSYRVQYSVTVSNKNVNFDIRYVGDNYYPADWEWNILKNRKKYRYFFVPSQEDLFFSLLYHALIHKREISEDYFEKFLTLSKNIGLHLKWKDLVEEKLLEILIDFMNEKKYEFVEPTDLSVYYNVNLLKKKIHVPVSLRRKIGLEKERFIFNTKVKIVNTLITTGLWDILKYGKKLIRKSST